MTSDGKFKVMVCNFPGNNVVHPDVMDYTTDLFVKLIHDPHVGPGNALRWRETTTPITKGRNKALVDAEAAGADYVLMLDNDLSPDMYVGPDGRPLRDQLGNMVVPNAKPFWESTWAFVRANPSLYTCIAAPYCGPSPVNNVFVFDWTNCKSGNSNADFQIQGVSRAHAAELTGIRPAAALPTGLMLIDMRLVREMKHPRTYYEYPDQRQTSLASTEDVTFSRDMWYTARLKGLPLFVGCNWDAWAGHWKLERVGKPAPIPAGAVPEWLYARGQDLAAKRDAAGPPPVDRLAPPEKPAITLSMPAEPGFCPLPGSHLPPSMGPTFAAVV